MYCHLLLTMLFFIQCDDSDSCCLQRKLLLNSHCYDEISFVYLNDTFLLGTALENKRLLFVSDRVNVWAVNQELSWLLIHGELQVSRKTCEFKTSTAMKVLWAMMAKILLGRSTDLLQNEDRGCKLVKKWLESILLLSLSRVNSAAKLLG